MLKRYFLNYKKRNFSTASIWIKGGSDMDSVGKKGINKILSSLLTRGCEGFDNLSLSEYIESYGAELNHEVYEDGISIGLKSLNEHFSKLLPLLDLIINKPILSEIEFQKVKKSSIDFIKKEKRNKTVIMFPENQYTGLIEQKLKEMNLTNIRTFKYNPNPQVLTGEIETLTNYTQRKNNLKLRKKMFEDKDDEQSTKELERLEQLYTLGDVNFDSVIIIDFGNNLKSVLTSLVYTDVNQDKVLFTTVNQWFDESIFYENTIKNIYYPSVNYKEFRRYNKNYYERFKKYPNEITILTYDALGLIYYAWKKNGYLNSVNDFSFKNKIKGKIGTFSFKDKKVVQELEIYKTENKKFIKY